MAIESRGARGGTTEGAIGEESGLEEMHGGHDPEHVRLHALFHKAPTFVAVHEGPEHHYFYINPMVEHAVSRPLLGRALRDAFPEFEEQGLLARYDAAYRTGEPSIVQEQRVVVTHHSTGAREERYFNHMLQPWLGEGGRIRGLISIAFEVTDLVRSRRALHESEQRYRILLERANDAILVYPLEADGRPGRYIEVNDVACRRLGYSREELLALTPDAVVDRGDIAYDDVLQELRRSGSVLFERHHRAKDGSRIPVEVNATLLELNGRPTVIAIARDVTERRRAEAAVRESEERLRFTLDAARVGTWDWDMTTGVVHWSDNLETIHNLPPGSFGGDFESVLRDVHPEDRERVLDTIRAAAEGSGLYEVEYRLPGPDGAERWVEGKGRQIRDASGRPVRMAGICTDITERKRAERVQRLLLYELQHRVKNTLAVVQSLASQTLRTSPSPAAFSAAFQGRLAALAEAHGLLARTNWEGADLHDLVTAELAPWQPGERLRLSGEPVVLPPAAALTVGMVLHELATNAIKHGALSTETGLLEVHWRLDGLPKAPRLAIEWVETGGPEVHPPARRGFGTRLIEQSVRYELDGKTWLEFRADGLRCRLVFPLRPQPSAHATTAPPAGKGAR